MKQIIFFSTLFVFSLLVSCAETKEGTRAEAKESIASIKIQEIGLEVMTKDLGERNWGDAKIACENFGDGWRLPTNEELSLMYINKDKIGGFTKNYYWSSTEYENYHAWVFSFNDGIVFGNFNKDFSFYVRAVRAIK